MKSLLTATFSRAVSAQDIAMTVTERMTMKEIRSNKHLRVRQTAMDGGYGIIRLPRQNKKGYTEASIIWSWGGGWEHVSVRPFSGANPTWDDMCFIKDMFWNDEDCVVQYHPPKSQYVNVAENCLHLWRPIGQSMPVPPMIFV